jgi:hypothetical protein
VIVGVHSVTCSTDPRNVLVARVATRDDVFEDGFE